MRAELRRLLRDIRGEFKGLPEIAPPESLLPIDERVKCWNVAIKLAKELGHDIDPVRQLALTGDRGPPFGAPHLLSAGEY